MRQEKERKKMSDLKELFEESWRGCGYSKAKIAVIVEKELGVAEQYLAEALKQKESEHTEQLKKIANEHQSKLDKITGISWTWEIQAKEAEGRLQQIRILPLDRLAEKLHDAIMNEPKRKSGWAKVFSPILHEWFDKELTELLGDKKE